MTKLDFSILDTNNPETIVFVDESQYGESPIFPTLKIKFPNLDKEYSAIIKPEKVNVLFTNSIGYNYTRTEFPDGLYELSYKIEKHSCPVVKCYLRTEKVFKQLKEFVALTNKDDSFYEKLGEISLILYASKLEVELNPKQAIEGLKTVKLLLENYVSAMPK